MIHDLSTMVWKEWRELLRQRDSWRSFLLGLLVPVGIFGILLPLQAGESWLRSPLSLSAWFYMPIAVVMTMMADSFAGERERHTLETLLASRLSDSAILYGKILAAVSYSIVLALCILAVGLISVNVAHGENGLMLYSAPFFWSGALVGVLLSLLGSSVGVLISLRAATVRQATQTMSYIMLALFFLPLVLIEFVPRALLRTTAAFLQSLLAGSPLLLGAGLLAAIVLLDVVLLLVARHRFQRNRLMLD